jgi:hypothetical protein
MAVHAEHAMTRVVTCDEVKLRVKDSGEYR